VVSILAVRSNERLRPTVAGAVGNVTPPFAVLFAVLFLDERLGWVQPVGLALVVGGVAFMALRGGAGGRHWPLWVLGLPLAAALMRGAVQPAIKTGLAIWQEPLAAAAIGYSLSTVVIVLLVGRPHLPKAQPTARVSVGFWRSACSTARRPFFSTRHWGWARSPWSRRWSRCFR
jgi:drug/metabolite transporter (DMT)-like permease